MCVRVYYHKRDRLLYIYIIHTAIVYVYIQVYIYAHARNTFFEVLHVHTHTIELAEPQKKKNGVMRERERKSNPHALCAHGPVHGAIAGAAVLTGFPPLKEPR